MPLTGPIPEGCSFFCSRCGALYSVTYSRRPLRSDSNNTAKCVVCGQTMATQGSTDVPNFKLVHRPDDA
jgi:transcription elongation factor Elf1